MIKDTGRIALQVADRAVDLCKGQHDATCAHWPRISVLGMSSTIPQSLRLPMRVLIRNNAVHLPAIFMARPPALIRLRIVESLGGIDPSSWNRFCGGNPFLRHEFLHALIDTGCASARTGWQPQ